MHDSKKTQTKGTHRTQKEKKKLHLYLEEGSHKHLREKNSWQHCSKEGCRGKSFASSYRMGKKGKFGEEGAIEIADEFIKEVLDAGGGKREGAILV